MMAAPGIPVKVVDYLSAKRIPMYVPEQRQKISFLLAEDRLVTALKKMTNGVIPVIVIQSISLVETLEYLGQGCLSGLYQKMDVVPHENICIEKIMVAILVDGEKLEIFLIVRRDFEYLLALVASGNDVVKRSLVFDARLACHDPRVAKEWGNVNILISDV
jgi:hypothetical protein